MMDELTVFANDTVIDFTINILREAGVDMDDAGFGMFGNLHPDKVFLAYVTAHRACGAEPLADRDEFMAYLSQSQANREWMACHGVEVPA